MKFLHLLIGLIVTLATLVSSIATNKDKPNHWAVLVAGSKTYMNYRHQADIAHAYHILKSNGYRDEHIITLMYDDVANSYMNPYPGTLINKPGGKDYYADLKIDYKGSDVTANTFEKVLTGEPTGCGNGKTLKSGPNDHVFIYFADHGGTGLIAFPTGIMTSMALHTTLKKMKSKNMYEHLVFYLESCESGSMFTNLDVKALNMYVTTAASASQSSYAIYWDMERRAFLGDRYSVFWMEDSDKYFGLNKIINPKETLENQFDRVYELVNPNSQPQEFGDMKYASMTVLEEFQADEDETVIHNKGSRHHEESIFEKLRDYLMGINLDYTTTTSTENESDIDYESKVMMDELSVDSRDVTLQTLFKIRDLEMMSNNVNLVDDLTLQIENEIRLKQEANDRIRFIAYEVDSKVANSYYQIGVTSNADGKIHHQCLHQVLMSFDKMCHAIDEYHIAHTGVFNRLCDEHAADFIVSIFEKSHLCQ